MTKDEAQEALRPLVEAIGRTQAQVASTCAEGHDMTPPPELLAELDRVRDLLITPDDCGA